MLQIRYSSDRGYVEQDWLKSYHTFSFGSYFDRKHMNFRSLRVMNEDWVAPNSGFPTHPHDNMEIITYVIEGRLAHRDSMGNQEQITHGEIQCMSAGTGITHSEFNPDDKDTTHLYQIWLVPAEKNIKPSYQQIRYDQALSGQLTLLASQQPRDGAVFINQDVDLYRAELTKGDALNFDIRPGRGVWLQTVRGALVVNGKAIQTGDALIVEDESQLVITAQDASEFLLFDLV
ncbi:pirin family protein [Thiomicrospira cyclica]|uniref:Pirin domain protein n=1 Tax=Thiomicrospira cyclica (strain DSM 14477 / JCM 11371 / ALM1) TaxID=717773 RepID=F6DBN2_THICA|nr:pirin family protein [Thiomicrospira cyclica]AEG32434.1 Pirin domain protein [Thiomicrospira cyclica ALM1]